MLRANRNEVSDGGGSADGQKLTPAFHGGDGDKMSLVRVTVSVWFWVLMSRFAEFRAVAEIEMNS